VKDLIAITVSTNYDDILSVVIHQNQRFFQTWYIITHPTDYATIDVVESADYTNIKLLYLIKVVLYVWRKNMSEKHICGNRFY